MEVHDITHELSLNPSVIFTKDKTKVNFYKDLCEKDYIKRVEDDIEERKLRLNKFKKLKWS